MKLWIKIFTEVTGIAVWVAGSVALISVGMPWVSDPRPGFILGAISLLALVTTAFYRDR